MTPLIITSLAAGYLAGASVAYAVSLDVIADRDHEGRLPFVLFWPASLTGYLVAFFGRRLNRLAKRRRAAKELPRAEVRR